MKSILTTILTAVVLLINIPCQADDGPVPDYLQPIAKHLSRGNPLMMPMDGNDIEIITDGVLQWELMIHDIQNSRKTIYMEYYQWANDDAGRQIHKAVMQKIREGLDVRILLEDLCHPLYPRHYYEELKEAGAQVAFFTDFDREFWQFAGEINHRDHRKILVIDDCLGYIGGRNISIHYRDDWRDTHLRITGNAVAQLRKLFTDMWRSRRGPQQNHSADIYPDWIEAVTPAVDEDRPFFYNNKTVQIATSGGDTLLEKAVCLILQSARDLVYIQTPYFCPTDTLLHSLQAAARRGIDVRVCLPQESDSGLMTLANQAYYEDCLTHGVRIFEYIPRFNHSKVVLCDGCLSMIGSLNMDPRSLCINHEDMATIYDTEVGEACRAEFLSLLEQSHEVTLEEVDAWPRKEKSARVFWRYHSSQL